jgi:glutamate N-acetyltransferase/amino-acid N-acetyltransferase
VLPKLTEVLAADNWRSAATAIMTTDLVAKYCSLEIRLGELRYRVSGMAKGSGMIHPNMATMLAFIATDADIPRAHLQRLLADCVDRSFNRISVDGDTSTNDACVLTATGKISNGSALTPDHPHWSAVASGINKAFESLAKSIVRDGEGATKFVEIIVESANENDSLAIATTVAQSPLVKTALFAGDANWGRFCMAIGRAPVDELDPNRVQLWLDDVQVAEGGLMSSSYTEQRGAAVLAQDEFKISIDLGMGDAQETIWTTDLSYEYVRINAEYRT